MRWSQNIKVKSDNDEYHKDRMKRRKGVHELHELKALNELKEKGVHELHEFTRIKRRKK